MNASKKVLPPLSKSNFEEHPEVKMFQEWMEEGVLVALDRNYLKSVIFGVYSLNPEKLHEAYCYNISYNDKNRCSGTFSKLGDAAGEVSRTDVEVAAQAKQMIRNVVSLCNTLETIPEERYLTMKLHFYEDITPHEWQPQHFKDSTGENKMCFRTKPLKLKVGKMRTKQHALSMHLSILDDDEAKTPTSDVEDDKDQSWSEDYFVAECELNQAPSPEREQTLHVQSNEDAGGKESPADKAISEVTSTLNELNLDETETYFKVAVSLLNKEIPRSEDGISEQFPTLSNSEVKAIVKHLEKDGVLESYSKGYRLARQPKNKKPDAAFRKLWNERTGGGNSDNAENNHNTSPKTPQTGAKSKKEKRLCSPQVERGSPKMKGRKRRASERETMLDHEERYQRSSIVIKTIVQKKSKHANLTLGEEGM